MYRTLVCLMCLAGLTLAPLGCAEKHQAKETTKIETPHGSDTKTVTVEEKKTGELKDNANQTTTPAPAPNP